MLLAKQNEIQLEDDQARRRARDYLSETGNRPDYINDDNMHLLNLDVAPEEDDDEEDLYADDDEEEEEPADEDDEDAEAQQQMDDRGKAAAIVKEEHEQMLQAAQKRILLEIKVFNWKSTHKV